MLEEYATSASETHTTVPELTEEIKSQLTSLGLEIEHNGFVVWRRDNRAHPRNWGGTRKAFDTSLIVAFDLSA